MPRKRRDVLLDTRAARLRLEPSKNPVWRQITRTQHLGYRRNSGDGTWYARIYLEGEYRQQRLGLADDRDGANGAGILTYDQALGLAHRWFASIVSSRFAYSVSTAVEEYHAYLLSEQKPSASNALNLRRAHLLREVEVQPGKRRPLGELEVDDLTAQLLREWRATILDDGLTRATANNTMAVLKAALNRAYEEKPDHVASDRAWRSLRPLSNANQARIGYFSQEQAERLLKECEVDFAKMVRAGLLTGCRHGELCRLDVADYHPHSVRPWLHIRISKGGRSRKVFLDDQGALFFDEIVQGRDFDEPMLLASIYAGVLSLLGQNAGQPDIRLIPKVQRILANAPERTRDVSSERLSQLVDLTSLHPRELFQEEYRRWKRHSRIRRMKRAAKKAGLRVRNFHALRHTYASLLIQAGMPLKFVAEQLGHTSTRMVEVHYGHLAPSVVAEALKSYMPVFRFGDDLPGPSEIDSESNEVS